MAQPLILLAVGWLEAHEEVGLHRAILGVRRIARQNAA